MNEGVVQKVRIFRDWVSNAKIQGQYSGLSQWEPNAAYTRPLYRARPAEQLRNVRAGWAHKEAVLTCMTS